jgi:predicted TIM-barrel fold metal-dependent hydrolase
VAKPGSFSHRCVEIGPLVGRLVHLTTPGRCQSATGPRADRALLGAGRTGPAGPACRLGRLLTCRFVDHYEPPADRPSDFAIGPDFRFVDAHVHLWDHARDELSWVLHDRGWEHPRLKGAWRLDQPKFSVPQYRSEVAGLGVVKMVHIQAATPDCGPAAETAWLQGLADVHGWPDAIVGPCDLTAPGAPDAIDQQVGYANFRGVRDIADGSLIGSPEWDRGYRALVGHGAVCDFMVTLDHFDQVLAVARRHPDATLVLEHAGLPVVSRLDAYFDQWRGALARLAVAPNVVIKISALSSGAVPNFFTDSIRRWVLTCIDLFGPDRCMFASNWPVDKLFVTYARLLATFRRIVEDLAPGEQQALFGSTAERVYRI